MKVLIAFGTRPETIKVAPLIREFAKFPDIECISCFTGQHKEMVLPLLTLFDITPKYDLGLMLGNKGLHELTSALLMEMTALIKLEQPNWVVVQGDTTTAMAAALAAFYLKVPVAHVEAGLRTGDRFQPFPEEFNRCAIDLISERCYAHSSWAFDNLTGEGISPARIAMVGNTVIDALYEIAARELAFSTQLLSSFFEDSVSKKILVTAHRRENFGLPMENICEAIRRVAELRKETVKFIFPVHLNPAVRLTIHRLLSDLPNVLLTEPLEYPDLVSILQRCDFILTDSGGLQEEGPAFGKPVIILRDVTERPEVVAAGCAVLVGTSPSLIESTVTLLLDDHATFSRMKNTHCPYGTGNSAERIVDDLISHTKRKASEEST